jgi:hypothetical protein
MGEMRKMKWLMVAFVAVFALMMWAMVQNEKQWQQYAAEHHCHPIGKKQGQLGGGISTSGKYVTTYTPDQMIYGCDGGEIQIR